MEMNYMLAFGSAEASLRLLWKFGLLEILLPFQVCGFNFLQLVCNSVSIYILQQHFFRSCDMTALCRQHILFPKVFGGAINDLTCFWYVRIPTVSMPFIQSTAS